MFFCVFGVSASSEQFVFLQGQRDQLYLGIWQKKSCFHSGEAIGYAKFAKTSHKEWMDHMHVIPASSKVHNLHTSAAVTANPISEQQLS